MSESENSSLNEKSVDTGVTSLSQRNEVKLSTALKQWENLDSTVVRTGVGCKCGAHTSAPWEKGGREWFTKHVTEIHAEAIDWKSLIKEALAMEPIKAVAFLSALIDADTPFVSESHAETLSNA